MLYLGGRLIFTGIVPVVYLVTMNFSIYIKMTENSAAKVKISFF